MPETKKEANAKSLDKRRAIIRAAKSMPCEDCKIKFNPVCMDLHHIEEDGFARQGSFIRWAMSHSIDALINEISKCEVVCANCHRLRHLGGT